MAYTYYQEINLEKHLYFAEEISVYLTMRNIEYTPSQVHKLMRENNAPLLYYKTSKGLKKVYDLDYVIELITGH